MLRIMWPVLGVGMVVRVSGVRVDVDPPDDPDRPSVVGNRRRTGQGGDRVTSSPYETASYPRDAGYWTRLNTYTRQLIAGRVHVYDRRRAKSRTVKIYNWPRTIEGLMVELRASVGDSMRFPPSAWLGDVAKILKLNGMEIGKFKSGKATVRRPGVQE